MNRFSVIASIIIILIMLLISCDFSPYEGEAQIGIDLGDLVSSDPNSGPPAGAVKAIQGAPLNINGFVDSVVISVSGPGVNTVSWTYSEPPRYLYVNVPAGNERTVELRINVNQASRNPVLAFAGRTTIDLRPGQFRWVPVNMMPVKTKIVIPDLGNEWVEQVYSLNPAASPFEYYSEGAGFRPYDIAFDGRGKIYIANNVDLPQGIIVWDDIDGTNMASINPGFQGSRVLAIDNYNGFIYCCSDSNISMLNMDYVVIGGPKAVGAIDITGLDVDKNGLLYIVGNYNNVQSVFQYDFNSGTISHATEVLNAVDVLLKDGYAYIACRDRIVRCNKDDFGNSIENGSRVDVPENPGEFYGPQRFLAIDEDRFYIIDENGGNDRLVSFENITNWSGWQTVTAGNYGDYAFRFYEVD